MKCPKCEGNHPRGKQGMTCICGYSFVLDPKADGYTDGKFLANVKRAGANETYFFTKNQLYAAACRGLRIQPTAFVSLLFIAAGAGMMYFNFDNFEDSTNPFTFLFIVGLVFFVIGLLAGSSAFSPRLSRKKWDKCFVKWMASGREIKGLIVSRQLETPPPEYNETDLYDYGVEQVVICERDELVDWLVLNRYHFNARAAVISESGYPPYLLPKINELLISDDPPKVCLLHDASDHGKKMMTRVQSSGVFDLKKAEVIDMGISPEIVSRIRSLKAVRRTTKNQDVTAAENRGNLVIAGELSTPCDPSAFPDMTTFLASLRGSFALCLREGETIHLARDLAGRRSLYYAMHEGRLLYASEPKAILAVPGFQRTLRPGAVAQYLTFSFIPGNGTMLEGLHALPAGSVVSFDGVTLTEPQRYHFPEEKETVDEVDWVRKFNLTLDKAIDRLVPENRDSLAVFLSGGIDSSIVTACLAERHHSKPLHSFSIHFGKRYDNELEFAKEVAKQCGTRHHEVAIEPKMFVPRLYDFIRALDEPIGDPVALPNFELARIVGKDFDHVFNGEGGDPLFGGPKNVPMMLHHWYGGESAHEPGHRERAYLTSYRRGYEELSHLLTPEFRKEIDEQRDLESVLTPFFTAPKPRRMINKLSLINMRLKGAHLILPKVERTLGAHGITPLSPLFDEDLIDLSFQIPPTLKLSRGVEKIIMKKAFAGRLPQSVIDRPKVGMRVPVYHWMQKEMKRYAQSVLSPKKIRGDGIFNEKRVKQLLDYNTEEGPGRYGLRLWMLTTFQIWKELVL